MSSQQIAGDESATESGDKHNREVFMRDGFLYKRQVLAKEEVIEWQAHFTELWSFVFTKLFDYGHTPFPTAEQEQEESSSTSGQKRFALGLGVKHGFREVVMRSPGRYELSLLNHEEWFQGEKDGLGLLARLKNLLSNLVLPLLCKSSWEEVNVTNLSIVVSTPGATTQGWHADGGHLSLGEHLPCHCFNIFIPLCDMPSMEWGPTELRPGSHYYTRNLAPMLLGAACRKELRPTVAPLLQQGDVLMFDYRVLHRGLANATKEHHRAVLVLTVSEKWFDDRLNFPKRSLYDKTKEEEQKDS